MTCSKTVAQKCSRVSENDNLFPICCVLLLCLSKLTKLLAMITSPCFHQICAAVSMVVEPVCCKWSRYRKFWQGIKIVDSFCYSFNVYTFLSFLAYFRLERCVWFFGFQNEYQYDKAYKIVMVSIASNAAEVWILIPTYSLKILDEREWCF